jgi:hypothetical protein
MGLGFMRRDIMCDGWDFTENSGETAEVVGFRT